MLSQFFSHMFTLRCYIFCYVKRRQAKELLIEQKKKRMGFCPFRVFLAGDHACSRRFSEKGHRMDRKMVRFWWNLELKLFGPLPTWPAIFGVISARCARRNYSKLRKNARVARNFPHSLVNFENWALWTIAHLTCYIWSDFRARSARKLLQVAQKCALSTFFGEPWKARIFTISVTVIEYLGHLATGDHSIFLFCLENRKNARVACIFPASGEGSIIPTPERSEVCTKSEASSATKYTYRVYPYVVRKSEFGAEMVTQYAKSKVELHNVSLKFRFSDLYVQEPIPKFWLRPRVLLKYALKKFQMQFLSLCFK